MIMYRSQIEWRVAVENDIEASQRLVDSFRGDSKCHIRRVSAIRARTFDHLGANIDTKTSVEEVGQL
jgi:hypothetical protein